jgi:hypothetical protein
MYGLWPLDPNPGREAEIIADLERDRAAIIVYSPTRIPHFPLMRDYVPVLFRYLVDHFAIERTAGGEPEGYTFVLLRRTPPAEGRRLLGPLLAEGQVRFAPGEGPPRDASAEERPRLVGEALWPFEPVLRVTTLPTESVTVSLPLEPQPGDRLELVYGLNPDRWLELPPTPVGFGVAIESDGIEHELVARVLDPRTRAADRAWIPARIDLSRWAGRAVTLVLRVSGPAGEWPQYDRAGWGDPRIIAGPRLRLGP